MSKAYKGKLLNLDDNAKTVKGRKKGFATAILYLAPVDLSGFQVCPMASQGCKAACLNTAGQGRFSSVQAARIAKTRAYFQQRTAFLAQLVDELSKFVAKAKAAGMVPVVRLNGTSDILWERVPLPTGERNVMERFPDVQFYDYTKHNPAKRLNLPTNYRLTYSLSDDPASEERAKAALVMGWSVAAVFKPHLPETYMGAPVVDGDEDDLRHLDAAGVIVGLKAKGRAKHDTTGFVRSV